MKNNFKLMALVAFISIASVIFAQSYPFPTYQSGHDIAEWNMRGGHIASDTAEPTGTASEGALFYDITTATQPLLYRYTDGAWAVAGGSGGGGSTATITTAIEENAASITLNIASISANAAGIVTNAGDLSTHEADQVDPHGATQTISQSLKVGDGDDEGSVEYNGTGTILIASYVQIPFEIATPTTISSDVVTLWADNTAKALKLHDGDEWLIVDTGVPSGVFAYLMAEADTTCTLADTWYPILGTFGNAPLENFSGTASPSIQYDGIKTRYFEIDWHTSLRSSDAGSEIHCTILHNGVEVSPGIMGTFCKNAGQAYAFSGTAVVLLSTGDDIQLVVQSDSTTNTVSIVHFTTTIKKFF